MASVTRKRITFENCSNSASPILIVEDSVHTWNTLCFIPAEGIDQIKLAFTCRGLKHTQGSTIWIQRTLECTFGECNRLRSCFVQNETTDFRMCDKKWCKRLLTPYDTAGRGGGDRTWVPIYFRMYLPMYLPPLYICHLTYRKIYFLQMFLHRWLVDQLYMLYTCMYVCVCVCACMCAHTYVSTHAHMYVCTCMHMGRWMCVSVCACVCMYACRERYTSYMP